MRALLNPIGRIVAGVSLLFGCAPSDTETTTPLVAPAAAPLRLALRDSSLVVGDTAQLFAVQPKPTDEPGTLTFRSSDTTVATVTTTGLVAARAAGSAIVSVQQAQVVASVTLAVSARPVVQTPVDTTQTPVPSAPVFAWTEPFTGQPTGPVPFASADWNVQRYSRDEETWLTPEPMEAQHAHDCGGPPAVHTITTYQQMVFRCRDHVMTAIRAGGYGAIVMTPNRMLDWTSGEQVLRVSVNTASQSQRDWWALWLTPWDDVLPLPAVDWAPGLHGYPRTSVLIEQGPNGVCPSLVANFVRTAIPCTASQPIAERMTVSFATRSVVEVRISRTHIKVWMPEQGIVFTDTDLASPLPFTQGVLQLAHYSYNPAKDCPAGQVCGPNTWHWDDLRLSTVVPFRIIDADVREVHTDDARVTFSAPAPAGATLRLTAGGYHPLLSFDDGATWVPPSQAPYKLKDAPEAQYVMAVPVGATSVRVKRGPIMISWWPRGWIARDFTIWAR